MEATIHGPLHREVMGPRDGPAMVFVHPNPMDSSSWLFQMAHFSTWFRCIAVDLPGYGRSPGADAGLTLEQIAAACWESVDAEGASASVLVGCSVGAALVQRMYHLRPSAVSALVLSGTGWNPGKEFAQRHIAAYRKHGLDYRWDYTLNDFSQEFRRPPLATWFAAMYRDRNSTADLDTIIHMFEAHALLDPEWLHADIAAPVLILTGSEDPAHPYAAALRDRIPGAEFAILDGAGHACHIEQPWKFDSEVIAFLRRHGYGELPATQLGA